MKKLNEQIKLLRIEFVSDDFDEKSVLKNPFLQFESWLQQAIDSGIAEPNAMTLATSGADGFVDARIVLLRDFDTNGFSFFTNYNSIKGKGIRLNKKVCLNFFWSELHRQVRIKGTATKLSKEISDDYFHSRPRESQIAAWASNQSEKLDNRMELENRFRNYENEFKGKKVPRPPHWGGYLVKPVYFEFWQGRPNRLHDRVIYQRNRTGKWIINRLNP